MKCPIDQTELLMTERQGVEIDYCPKCRGVWLDRGELDKLIERADRYDARYDRDDDEPQRPAPQAPPQYGAPQQPQRSSSPDIAGIVGDLISKKMSSKSGHSGHKKKGGLGSFFDF